MGDPRDVEICRLQEEVKALRAERAGDQQRLLHYEHQLELGTQELERLRAVIQRYENDRIANLGGIGSPA